MPINMRSKPNELTISAFAELPRTCVSCGSDANQFKSVRCFDNRKQTAKSVLSLLSLFAGGFWGNLLVDEATDHRPIDIQLPICGEPTCTNGHGIKGRILRGHRVVISGLQPDFVRATIRHQQNIWLTISDHVPDSENKWEVLARKIDEAKQIS